jgi:O-antigen/teichoic acid export membrane protein
VKKAFHKIIREDNFLSLAGNLVIAASGLAGFAVLARSLSLDQFGEWVLFISSGSFIEMFRFGITNTGLVRYLSGADEPSRISLIGSNGVISMLSTLSIIVVMAGCNLLFHDSLQQAGYGLFFTWYPLMALVNLPWNNALVILQADRQYGKMLLIKALNSIPFLFVVVYNYFTAALSLTQLAIALLLINAFTSGISLIAGWDGIRFLFNASRETTSRLLHFGKYTTFTLVGTNLLRSADSIIISLSPLGVSAVALYSIPLKLTELQQIPLRSFAATAFPKMSKASIEGRTEAVKKLFYTYTGAITYLFVGVSLFTFVFADFFVLLLAGKAFMQNNPDAGQAILIVRIFSLYGLLLPLDRMTGIALDSINRPAVNALKVLFMVLINITGDLLAVFVFKSLLLVAIASILFTGMGIWLGMYFLNKELKLQYAGIFTEGLHFYKNIFHKVSSGSMTTAVNGNSKW